MSLLTGAGVAEVEVVCVRLVEDVSELVVRVWLVEDVSDELVFV